MESEALLANLLLHEETNAPVTADLLAAAVGTAACGFYHEQGMAIDGRGGQWLKG